MDRIIFIGKNGPAFQVLVDRLDVMDGKLDDIKKGTISAEQAAQIEAGLKTVAEHLGKVAQ
jgi:hypothetical protein